MRTRHGYTNWLVVVDHYMFHHPRPHCPCAFASASLVVPGQNILIPADNQLKTIQTALDNLLTGYVDQFTSLNATLVRCFGNSPACGTIPPASDDTIMRFLLSTLIDPLVPLSASESYWQAG